MIPSVYDDELCSSTHSVRSLVQPSKTVVSRKRRRKNSSPVSFNEDVTVFPSGQEYIYEDELRNQWYNGNDYQQFKVNFYLAAKDLIRSEKKAAQLNDGENSYGKVMLRVFKSCCKATTDDQSFTSATDDRKLFQQWMSVTSSHRAGLERFAAQKIYKDKASRRIELLDTILKLQHFCNNRGYKMEEQSEMIAHVAQQISRPSRMFALLLA